MSAYHALALIYAHSQHTPISIGNSVSSQEYVSTTCKRSLPFPTTRVAHGVLGASLMMHQTRPHTISCTRGLCREFAEDIDATVERG